MKKSVISAPSQRWLRTKQAAKYMGIGPGKLRTLVHMGVLSIVDDGDGSPWRFDLYELDAYMERHRQRVI